MTAGNPRNHFLNWALFWCGIFFLACNFLIGVQKPLWLDEVITFITLGPPNAGALISNLYSGCDTNPPLYFISAFLFAKMTSSTVLALRLLSLVFALAGLVVFYRGYKDRIRLESFLLCFLIIAVSSFFSQYLITEIRAYSLVFALSFLLIGQYREISRLDALKIWKILIYALVITLVLYVHYVSLLYVGILLLVEILYSLPKRKLNVFFAALVALTAYAPWLGGMLNQLKTVHYTSWQQPPSVVQVLGTPHYFFGYPLLLILAICALAVVFRRDVSTSAFFAEENRQEVVLLGLFALVPLFVYLLSFSVEVVFTQRYFVPSYVSMIILLSMLINDFLPNRLYLTVVLIVLLGGLGVHKAVAYKKIVENLKVKMERNLKLNAEGIPIVCESPHVFYPLDFDSLREGDSHFYLVLDEESARAEGNIRNALFDYYGNSRLKEVYTLPRIVLWSDFRKSFSEFFVINEKNRMLFERRIEKDPHYRVQPMTDGSIFRVIKTE